MQTLGAKIIFYKNKIKTSISYKVKRKRKKKTSSVIGFNCTWCKNLATGLIVLILHININKLWIDLYEAIIRFKSIKIFICNLNLYLCI